MDFLFFLLFLSLLVIIHELGHFLAARMFGIKAEEFGFGFPPRIFGFVKDGSRWKMIGAKDDAEYSNTIWSLNWLPLGGFVRIKGEQEDGINDRDSIHAKPIWQRIIVIAAGVFMNWMLAFVLFSIVLAVGTLSSLEDLPAGARVTDRAIGITQVLPGSPADRSGLIVGDTVLSMNGVAPTSSMALRDAIQTEKTRELTLVIRRGSEQQTVTTTPAYVSDIQRVGLGIGLTDVGHVSFPLPQAIVNGFSMTLGLTKAIILAFGGILRDLVIHRTVPPDVSGPVGIAVVAGQIVKQGIMPFVQFAAMLSVNLAVINVLPIPALDGGRLVFLVLEKIRRKPMSRKLEIAVHNVAFILLIVLIIAVTARDLSRYGGMIVGGVKGIVGM